ncbi:Transcriptional regulator NovG [Aquisphaera giovannonii]|uniref:Transcriptional regulator NovG n=1 Tax=Aquisphaera giovannonii TaxID=406548 RepID=A0A5B9W1E1_9BACT|nr:ParB/RepB/Spo0J family partition protein [Aquisphaera giovannonii]QEH34089.1 Transcriptional regulator NovG [Aquisphaera giovannonii]
MDIRNVALNDLILDQNLYLRDRLDDFTVERYADSWDRLPPITLYEVDGKLLIADGFHRHAAAVMLGKRTIPAEVRAGTFTEALDFAASVNLFHGLPLTRSERRRAVEVKLKLHHDWSDRRMAEELAVSRELVAKIRRQLIEGNQIPNNPGRVGADGKLYTSAGLPRPKLEESYPEPAQFQDDFDSRPERGRRGMSGAAVHQDEAPGKARGKASIAEEVHFQGGEDPRVVAAQPPVDVSAPTIDEMLELMANRIQEVLDWTKAEGFPESYREAGANARGQFQAVAFNLYRRAEVLRKG